MLINQHNNMSALQLSFRKRVNTEPSHRQVTRGSRKPNSMNFTYALNNTNITHPTLANTRAYLSVWKCRKKGLPNNQNTTKQCGKYAYGLYRHSYLT